MLTYPRRTAIFVLLLASFTSVSSRAQEPAATPGLETLEPFVPKAPREEADEDRILSSILFAEGRLLFRREKYAEALQRYERAYRYSNQAHTIVSEIIPLAFRLGRDEEAIRYAELAGSGPGRLWTLPRRALWDGGESAGRRRAPPDQRIQRLQRRPPGVHLRQRRYRPILEVDDIHDAAGAERRGGDCGRWEWQHRVCERPAPHLRKSAPQLPGPKSFRFQHGFWREFLARAVKFPCRRLRLQWGRLPSAVSGQRDCAASRARGPATGAERARRHSQQQRAPKDAGAQKHRRSAELGQESSAGGVGICWLLCDGFGALTTRSGAALRVGWDEQGVCGERRLLGVV